MPERLLNLVASQIRGQERKRYEVEQYILTFSSVEDVLGETEYFRLQSTERQVSASKGISKDIIRFEKQKEAPELKYVRIE